MEHLIASHIQPWRDSSNEQRLDGENGLLLTPTVDRLFDEGFISFENWVEPVYVGLVVAAMLVGSLIKLWRAMRYGDFSVKGQWFWLPRSWRAWMHGSPDEKSRARH